MNAMSPILAAMDDVQFREERFSDLRDEGSFLFKAHWLEANVDPSCPLDVDWEIYEKFEALDLAVCVTARAGIRLIGYAVYMIVPSMHYRGRRLGVADVFYLMPFYRRGWVGVQLFRSAEDVLRQRGVHVMETRVKNHVKDGRVGSIMQRLGAVCVETQWRKALD